METKELVDYAIKVIPLLIAGLWAVFEIKGTTSKLTQSIEHLTTSVNKLDTALGNTQKDVGIIKERLVAVETIANIFGTGNGKSNH